MVGGGINRLFLDCTGGVNTGEIDGFTNIIYRSGSFLSLSIYVLLSIMNNAAGVDDGIQNNTSYIYMIYLWYYVITIKKRSI